MNQKTEEVVVFDTEFTAWPGSVERGWRGPSEYKEIVQIGAVTLDARNLQEIASFSALIKPTMNPVLSDYLVRLTRITNAQLAKVGVDFAKGISDYQSFAGGRKSFCYGRDDRIIAENAKLLGQPALWSAATSTNLRDWLVHVGVPLAGIHAGELSAHVGAASQGPAHNALTDARSLAEAVRYLVKKGAPNPFFGRPKKDPLPQGERKRR
jgi:inhibitor of KinA sporulation pathway (predicted exonuclease)